MNVGLWVWEFSVLAGYHSTGLLPMAAQVLSWHAKIVVRRHVPSAHVSILKNFVSDLMTRAALSLGHSRPRTSMQSIETPEGAGNP